MQAQWGFPARFWSDSWFSMGLSAVSRISVTLKWVFSRRILDFPVNVDREKWAVRESAGERFCKLGLT